MLFSIVLELFITKRAASGFNQSGINGDALVDSEALQFKLPKDIGVDLIHGIF